VCVCVVGNIVWRGGQGEEWVKGKGEGGGEEDIERGEGDRRGEGKG